MNDKNNMLALSQERFSARKFTPEALSQEDLDYIMGCVRLAPSAVNRQPWRWLIVRSEEAKKKLQDCYDREWFIPTSSGMPRRLFLMAISCRALILSRPLMLKTPPMLPWAISLPT